MTDASERPEPWTPMHAAAEHQRANGLSDYAMADLLGLNRETWRKVRQGYRPDLDTLALIAYAFPGHDRGLLRWLHERGARVWAERKQRPAPEPPTPLLAAS